VKDVVVVSALFAVLVFLCAYWPAQISGPADALDNNYQPKPEWTFLFLYQALKAFHGPWEVVGTVAIPMAITGIFFLLPFLDRGEERSPSKRRVAMAAGFVFVAGVLVLTYFGYLSKPGEVKAASTAGAADSTAPEATQETAEAVESTAPQETAEPDNSAAAAAPQETAEPDNSAAAAAPQETAEAVESTAAAGAGGGSSGDETTSGSETSQAAGSEKAGEAEASGGSADQEGAAATQAAGTAEGKAVGRAASWVGNRELGGTLFSQSCASCHGDEGKGGVMNPGAADGTVPAVSPISADFKSEDAVTFAANIDRVIQHGSVPAGEHPVMQMPVFGDTRTLTQQQISALEAYILSLNGVDRAQITQPGVEPRVFAWGVAGAFAAAWAVMGLLWRSGRGKGSAEGEKG
jgi:mono/diheme cytochrome c family protein